MLMKNLYLSVLCAGISCAASAATVSLDMIQHAWRNADAKSTSVKMKPVKKMSPTVTRSVDQPQTSFTATAAEFYYYGDVLGNGTGVYHLYLANMDMDKGMPSGEGQMARLEIIGTQTDPDNPQLCTGTFTVFPLIDQIPEDGALIGEDSDILDVFPYPDDPSLGLVAYAFQPVDGSLSIEKVGDNYSISYDFTGALIDEDTDEVIFSDKCTCSFEGPCEYVDVYGYTPFEEDIHLSDLKASGRYTDGGDYSISFYTPGLIDDEGWIVSSGYLLNAELFVENVSPMNLDDLCATFTPNDVFANGTVQGTFGEGVWYEMFSGMYVPLLTAVTEYDQYGSESKVALAVDGTITGSKEGDNYKLVFDLISAEGHKITAEYVGDLKADVTDFSSSSSVIGISQNVEIKGGKGCVYAPVDAKVFNLNGTRTDARNLPAGIYIVSHEGKSHKVVVR